MKALVIGGGVIGSLTTWYLLRSGHEVTLIDRAPELAAEGSHANGAMLHAGCSEPWNSPAALGDLLRTVGRADSPLRVPPGQIPDLLGWGLRFLWHSRPSAYRRALARNTRLALYSRALMQDLRSTIGCGWDHQAAGILRICRTERSRWNMWRLAEIMAGLGTRVEPLDRDGVLRHEPALAPAADALTGGIFIPDDESGDACALCRLLGNRMRDQGLHFAAGTTVRQIDQKAGRVTGIDTDRGYFTADRYILAAGVDAPLLARPLGMRLPIRPIKGHSATLAVDGHPAAPTVPMIDNDRKLVITRLGDRLRVAGNAEFVGYDRSIPQERVRAIVDRALSNFPEYAESVRGAALHPWSCLRPVTADGPPILGPTALPNLYLNTGPGHLGWTIAAACARVVADLVSGREPEIELSGLTLTDRG